MNKMVQYSMRVVLTKLTFQLAGKITLFVLPVDKTHWHKRVISRLSMYEFIKDDSWVECKKEGQCFGLLQEIQLEEMVLPLL